jgi:predicted RNA-binding protein YlxR (DUF448 family)
MLPKIELVRILRTPEGAICLDDTGKKNGRGAYLCKQGECLTKARKKKSLERALQTDVPEAVYEVLWEELRDFEAKQSTVVVRTDSEGRQTGER